MVSVVVIDYKRENPLLRQCLEEIEKQTYKDYEIILLTDYKNDLDFPRLRKFSYGKYVDPARKRDDGAKMARGEIVVFIDDDAYPSRNWLRDIIKSFSDPRIAAVGGPGVTPPDSSWQEEASGWVSASPLGGGFCSHRFLLAKRRLVDDYPTMNLAVRRADFLAVGGFDCRFWPGEDTKLCLDLVHKLGKKIVYEPKALVYHHRRPLWLAHLQQNGGYGLHRGYFARVLPQTSLRASYFAPAGLVVFFPLVIPLYAFLLILNAIWVTGKSRSLWQGLISLPSVFLTHFWYGIKFLQGFLFTKSLRR